MLRNLIAANPGVAAFVGLSRGFRGPSRRHLAPCGGARLGPAGGLCVAVRGENGLVRLTESPLSALGTNPRCGGETIGTPIDWIAPGLSPYAELRLGAVEKAASQAVRSVGIPATQVLFRPGPMLRAWVDPSLLLRCAPRRATSWSICPARRGPRKETLLVCLGAQDKRYELEICGSKRQTACGVIRPAGTSSSRLHKACCLTSFMRRRCRGAWGRSAGECRPASGARSPPVQSSRCAIAAGL